MEQTTSLQAPGPQITPQAIQCVKEEMILLEGLVRDVLKGGIDYGRIPGTPADSLWDPGASKIIGAFNCYVGSRRLLHFRDDGKVIAVIFEIPLVSRAAQVQVGSGVGAASTYETKYKYRWVDQPKEWGYTEEALKGLKTRKGDRGGRTEYRIRNPEHDELLNTIVKMASKRAEVDAAAGLPGVATALRELFTHTIPGPKGAAKTEVKTDDEGPAWSEFWGQVRKMGLTQQEARKMLGVKSVTEWTNAGRTLEEAIETLRARLTSDLFGEAPERSQEAAELEANRDGLIAELNEIFQQLAWMPGTVEQWCLQNVGYKTTDKMPTVAIATAVAKAKNLLGN